MNKSELINAVFNKVVLPKKDCENIINETFNAILEALSNNEEVMITGFGAFEVKESKEKKVTNLHTKQVISVPPTKTIKFHPCKKAKEQVKN